jgi:hypothetical protein
MVGNTSYRPRDQVRQPPLFLLSDTHALKDEMALGSDSRRQVCDWFVKGYALLWQA